MRTLSLDLGGTLCQAIRGLCAGCKGHFSVEAKANAWDCCDLGWFLTCLDGSRAKITAQFCDAGVESVLTRRLIVGLAPDGLKTGFTGADGAGVPGKMQQEAIFKGAKWHQATVYLNGARVFVD